MPRASKSAQNHAAKPPYKAEAISRATQVLMLFDRNTRTRTLSELAERTAVPKATLKGILNTLVIHDLLAFDESEDRYRLGYAWLRLGDVRRNQSDIRGLALPLMREMRDALDETVILSLKVGDRRVHIDYVESTQAIRRVGQLGGETPLHVGAAALVLLAGMSDGEIENYMARTPSAAAKRGKILEEVMAIRRDGYAVAAGTINPQTAAVAAPVRSSSGESIAALAISCPIERYTKELNRRCIASAVENARRLSQSLGYRS